jgi:hypothetical protein
MTNEERIQFVQEQVQRLDPLPMGSRDTESEMNVIRAIVDRWEDDADEARERGIDAALIASANAPMNCSD